MARYHPPRATLRYLFLAFLAMLALARVAWISHDQTRQAPLSEGEHQVARVIDGDTLVLKTGHRVRLQGIDTPEAARDDQPAEAGSTEATHYARAFVERTNRVVRLTFTDERLDRYGRTLAFVWQGDRCLNEELVREGLAHARLDYRFSGVMRTRLRKAQEEARSNGVGLWEK